jgi:hypothetical protein
MHLSDLPQRPGRGMALMIALLLWLGAAASHAGLLGQLFAPKAELWERWLAHDPADTREPSHAAWDAFLGRYLRTVADGANRVDYAAVTTQDRAALQGYIEALSFVAISGYSRPAQFAYWVNLYNALTVQVVLEHYPVASIRDIDISPGLFANGPWGRALVEVEGEPLSLDDIEHRVLRPIWQDPRIHYAVNCAAIGCPDLQPRAFTAANSEALLEAGARAYVNDARGLGLDGEGVVLSRIYEWFAADFAIDGGVLAHLARYAEGDRRAALAGEPTIRGYHYDWRLNAAE